MQGLNFWVGPLCCLCALSLLTASCSRRSIQGVSTREVYRQGSPSTIEAPADERPERPKAPEEPRRPGELASVALTQQARRFLESGNVESAIRVLERSVALHPYNGENYYLLAEAWIAKKDFGRASAFHRMAETYLKKDPSWEDRILDQQHRLSALK